MAAVMLLLGSARPWRGRERMVGGDRSAHGSPRQKMQLQRHPALTAFYALAKRAFRSQLAR